MYIFGVCVCVRSETDSGFLWNWTEYDFVEHFSFFNTVMFRSILPEKESIPPRSQTGKTYVVRPRG